MPPLCTGCYAHHVPEGKHLKPLRTSQQWCDATGIVVVDPDGWDRRNLDASWEERISLTIFLRRAAGSTVDLARLTEVTENVRTHG